MDEEAPPHPIETERKTSDEPREPQPAPVETEGKASVEPHQPLSGAGLGPAYAILRALVGERIPGGPLGPETVPVAVLGMPVRLAIEMLSVHGKKCKSSRCTHTPATLWPYLHMREDAIRGASDQVYKALWKYADHPFVDQIRKTILENYPKLAADVSGGSLLNSEALAEILKDATQDARLLAAVLWASEFDVPSGEAMFRALVPLAEGSVSRGASKLVRANSEELKFKAKLRQSAKDLKESERKRDESERKKDKSERESKTSHRLLEKTSRELRDIGTKHQATINELDTVTAKLQETERTLEDLERGAAEVTKVNGYLRRDLRELQQAQRALEAERSDLARELAEDKREIAQRVRELNNLPEGAEAFWSFLRDENRRIQDLRLVTESGEPKVRADEAWRLHGKLETAFLDAYSTYRTPRPVRIRPKTRLRFVALGGSAEIGRSCYLLELGERRVLVDCGIKVGGGSEDLYPRIDNLERLDALILTHAHTDHVAWVPALVRRIPDLDIYCSASTAALLPLVLQDCHQHYMRKIAQRRLVTSYSRNPEAVEVEYDEEDVLAVPKRAITCDFDREAALFGDVTAKFFRAGHILGAASVLVADASGRRVFFSGDFSSFPQLTIPSARWPDDLDQIDLLVLETTYANRPAHNPMEATRNELLRLIRHTTEDRKGTAILASFALGRAQELLKLIVTARHDGQLSPSIPIYVDGLIRQINPIYRKFADFDLPADAFIEVSGRTEREEIARYAESKPSIIVTTSGMVNGGPVVEYAHRLLPEARNRLILTGYQDEGAPGKALRDLTESGGAVEILDESGKAIKIQAAAPAYVVGLSAHADEPGLLDYAAKLKPSQIALVHGDSKAQIQFSSRLQKIHPKAEIVCGPDELEVR